MRSVWSRRAAGHLVAIREYIEQDNAKAAELVALRIRDAVRQLALIRLWVVPEESEVPASWSSPGRHISSRIV
jgi:plasmid stabilization system protein ParE